MMKRICTFISFLVLKISYNNGDASLSIQHGGRRLTTLIPRGGDVDKVHDNTNIEKKHQQTSAISLPLSSLPLVDTLSVSLALRLTAETNRRLQHSTSKEQHKEETLFHSSVSYQESPELKTYLDTLLSAAGLEESTSTNPMDDERQLVLSLALLYIDRSTSVDTPTDDYHQTGQMGGGSHPSPYISPRTVHYMVLTSLSIAIKCVRGDKDNDVSNKLSDAANSIYEKNSISMEQMERTLLHSLSGSSTGNVSHEEISTFMRQFATMMYPMRLKAHEQTKLKQLERFMRHQNAGFGSVQVNNQHGHGNHWQQSDDSHANNRLSIESRRNDDSQWQTEQQYYPDQQQY